MVVEGYTDQELKAINDGAYRAYQVGRGYLELSDCQQEAWLWVIENEERVAAERDDEGSPTASSISSLGSHAYRAALAHVRYVMQSRGKTRPQDYATYDTSRVQDLLPELFNGHGFTAGPQVNEDIKSTTAPNEGGTWLVTLIDVQNAFKKLTQDQRQLLFALHSDPEATYRSVGEEFDITEAQVRRRETKALEAIVDCLGGPRVGKEYQRDRKGYRDMH